MVGITGMTEQVKQQPRPEHLTFDLKAIRRPITDVIIAWRLMFVIPNRAKWNMLRKCYETSYHKKYLVFWEGDFNAGYVLTTKRFIEFLGEHNIDIDMLNAESNVAKGLIKAARARLAIGKGA